MFRFWLYWYKILIIFWQRRWGPSWVIRVAGDPAAPGDRRTWPLQPPARTSSSSLVSSPFKYICKYMMSIWNIFFTRLSSYTHIPIPEVTLHWEFNVRNYYSVGIITQTKKLFQLGVYTLGISSWNFHGLKIPNSVRIPNPLVSWIMLTLGDIEGVGAESARPLAGGSQVSQICALLEWEWQLGGWVTPGWLEMQVMHLCFCCCTIVAAKSDPAGHQILHSLCKSCNSASTNSRYVPSHCHLGSLVSPYPPHMYQHDTWLWTRLPKESCQILDFFC